MELVYLWVEDYKNIHHQGFNFSPRFECKYEDGVLDIKDKEETGEPYLKDFFGKNINITAIVGENGSGKSSVLDLLFLSDRQSSQNKYKYLVFYKTATKIYYHISFSSIDSIECPNYQTEKLSFVSEPMLNIKYLSILEKNFIHPIVKNKIKINTTNISYEQKILINSLKLFANQNEIILKDKNINFDTLLLKIKKISLNENIDENIKSKYSNFIQDNFPFNSTSDKVVNMHKLDTFVIINTLTALVNYYNETEFIDNIAKIFDTNNQEINIDVVLKFIDCEREEDICSLLEHTKTFLTQLKKFDFHGSLLGTSEANYETILNINGNKDFLLGFINQFNNFINFYDDTSYFDFQMLEIDLFSNNIKYRGLSDGEKNIYSKIIELKYELMFSKKNNFFLLDEPDNFLHPNWSKEFIKILLDNINNEKVHLVLTSHSPFILSDLPKENVIFLEKYNENDNEVKNGSQKIGNCKNATKDVNINPFGANIHTLLSHGFFMKDGLMGEFAKGKIEDVINYLNDKESTIKDNDEAQKLLNIIGEPIIKNQLQKMLGSKRLSKVDEINKIKLDMANLAKRLEELEK